MATELAQTADLASPRRKLDDALLAVSVRDLSKSFLVPREQVSTLKERVLHPFRRKGHERLEALNDVTFDVREGEFLGIIGRNGSGKSTLLKCLAGIYRPDSGSVSVRGRLSPFLELGVGFNPDLAARDNVTINATLLGLTPSEARSRFDDIIAFAELEEFVDMKLKNYSSGMQVRLAFAVSIQVDADILLVDEVLAVGDAVFQEKCFDTFHRLKREGKTVLFVTHDLGSVQRFCDRVLYLENGRMVDLGDPTEVVFEYGQANLERERAGRDAGSATHGVSEALSAPSRGEGVTEPGNAPATRERQRWGDGAAEILDAWFENASGRRTSLLTQDRDIKFKSRVLVHEPMDDVDMSLTIYSADGVEIMSLNSFWVGANVPHASPGQEMTISWVFPNWLGHGEHFASTGVARESGTKLADWRPRMLTFKVHRDQPSSALMEIPYKVEVATRERP